MYWFSVNCWAVLPSDNVIVMSVSVGIYFKKKGKKKCAIPCRQCLDSLVWDALNSIH